MKTKAFAKPQQKENRLIVLGLEVGSTVARVPPPNSETLPEKTGYVPGRNTGWQAPARV